MTHVPSEHPEQLQQDGGFPSLTEAERALLAERVPAPRGGRALSLSHSPGALPDHLAALGYQVDAVSLSPSAPQADTAHPEARPVRSLRWDIEHGDPAVLHPGGYDLIALRHILTALQDRTRVLRLLARRLRPGGTLAVITAVPGHTSRERHTTLDEDELALATEGWQDVERLEAGRLAVLVLRRPKPAATVPVERDKPLTGPAGVAAVAVVTDPAGRVLLGYSRRGMWELPGGKPAAGESFEEAALRKLAEETGLEAAAADTRLVATLLDAAQDVPRITAVVRTTACGQPTNPEPEKFLRWEWMDPGDLAFMGRMFTPSVQALACLYPLAVPSLAPVNTYPHIPAPAPAATAAVPSYEGVVVATATREGTSGPLADAVRHYTARDGSTAVALADGSGHSDQTVAVAPVLAEVAARTGAVHYAVRGVLSAAAVVADRGPDGDGPSAVAAVAVCPPGEMTMAAWAGDVRVYGWDGHRLHLHSTDQTVAEQMRQYLGLTGPLPAPASDFLRGSLTNVTLETVPGVRVPAREVIIMTSDGVHDQLPAGRLEQLIRDHVTDPQHLADQLVAAAEADSTGYRDDATAAVLVRPEARQSTTGGHTQGGKLVRDRIPEIIRATGAEPITYTAGPAEYPGLLLAKLYEELGELAHADTSAKPEELADLTEALDAYARELGVSNDELEALRADKRRARGGFSDGVVWLGNR